MMIQALGFSVNDIEKRFKMKSNIDRKDKYDRSIEVVFIYYV